MNGQPPHHTTGVASRNPKIPIESPNGGVAGSPIIAPMGEKAIIGRDSGVETMKRRHRSATISAL
jgi:hypothetical protein